MSLNPPPSQSPQSTSGKWWIMLGVGLGVLMFTLDTSIVNADISSPAQPKCIKTGSQEKPNQKRVITVINDISFGKH